MSISSAISFGSPVITLSIGGGSPASYSTSASSSAASGVFSVGLSTMRLLVATDGATLWITWFSGWLNGVMAVITPSSGSRIVCTRRCLPWCVRSQEKLWPSSTSACWAANSSTSQARPTS